jgi:hypothetical protein
MQEAENKAQPVFSREYEAGFADAVAQLKSRVLGVVVPKSHQIGIEDFARTLRPGARIDTFTAAERKGKFQPDDPNELTSPYPPIEIIPVAAGDGAAIAHMPVVSDDGHLTVKRPFGDARDAAVIEMGRVKCRAVLEILEVGNNKEQSKLPVRIDATILLSESDESSFGPKLAKARTSLKLFVGDAPFSHVLTPVRPA